MPTTNHNENITSNMSSQQSQLTYAQKMQFPTKEEAIVLDSIDGISIHSYTVAIGKLIEPKNVKFSSRISQNRVCMYLNSKRIVEKLIEEHPLVQVENHSLTVRPLISKAKRLIISNVCPVIPHSAIVQELIKLNIQPASEVTFIKGGNKEPGYEHVLSFRRQVYVNPNGIDKIPSLLKMEYDGTNYWLYFSTDKVTCFLCKEEGHIAKFCKANVAEVISQDPFDDSNTEKNNSSELTFTTLGTLSQNQTIIDPVNFPTLTNKVKPSLPETTKSSQPTVFKRPASSTSTSVSSLNMSSNNPTKPVHALRAKKKPKRFEEAVSSREAVQNQLEPAKVFFDEHKKLPISFDCLVNFLVESHHASNIPAIASKNSCNTKVFTDILSQVRSIINDKNLKSRMARIIKRLNSANYSSETNSECSETDMDQENLSP